LKDGRDARKLLNWVRDSSVTAKQLIESFPRAFSGRLELKNGELNYCTGQYFPTEYRKAVCAVLAYALWNCYRTEESTGDSLRATFRRIFGRGIQKRWFN